MSHMLRASSPDALRSTRDSANSTTMSARCVWPRASPAVLLRPSSRSTAVMSTRRARNAGTKPKNTPAASEAAIENAHTRQSIEISLTRGTLSGSRPDERVPRRGDDRHAECAADHREDDAFREELPDEPRRASAECLTDRHLSTARRRSREQQIGDVRAPDEQHQTDAAEQKQQRSTDIAGDTVGEWKHAHVPVARRRVVRGILPSQRLHEHIDAALRVGDGDAGREPTDRARKESRARLDRGLVERRAAKPERRPDLGSALFARVARRLKASRHHADDAIRIGIELHDPADDSGIGAEHSLPQAVADDRLLVEPGSRIARVERVAEPRSHAEQVEVVRRDDEQADALRAGQSAEVVVVEPARRDVGEDAGAFQIVPLRNRHADVARADAGIVVHDAHELLGVRVRQRPQQRRVDDTEERRAAAHTDRHGRAPRQS